MKKSIESYLELHPSLAMLETVRYQEFVSGGINEGRVEFIRESGSLFRALLVLVVAFSSVNLAVHSVFSSYRRAERWAIQRALGASRRQLTISEDIPVLAIYLGMVLLGGACGAVLAPLLGGTPAGLPLALSILIGSGSVVLGTLLTTRRVRTLTPARGIGVGRLMRSGSIIVTVSSVCLALAFGLVITSGGIYLAGELKLDRELAGIGAGLVRLTPDRTSLLPVAAISPSEIVSLRQQFPGVRITYVDRVRSQLVHEKSDVTTTLVRADEDFPAVSRTELAIGEWDPDGIVIGAGIARVLFPQGDALGKPVRLTGIASSTGEVPVVGVARPPSTHKLETLQLRQDSAWIHTTAVSDARSPAARVYFDRNTLGRFEIQDIVQALNDDRVGTAPFAPVLVAQTYLNYMTKLRAHSRRFKGAAVLLLPLSGVALLQLATAGSAARRRRRTVERIVGATWRDRFWSELREGVGPLILVIIGAFAVATPVLAVWSHSSENALVFPTTWVLLGVTAVIGLGVPAVLLQARYSLRTSPMSETRFE